MTDAAMDPPRDGFVVGLARSGATRPFWDGLARGQLRLPRCLACGSLFFPPRRLCPQCWSEDIDWESSTGRGHLYAVTTVHVPFEPDAQVPLTVALVDLEEGVRMAGVLDPYDSGFQVGDRLEIDFPDDPASTLPVFRRADGA
jgi:uncharacterized protein